MICKIKHTRFQPKEWKCPNCDSDSEGLDAFYIYESVGHEECTLLHNNDYVVCDNCQDGWGGDELSDIMAKNEGMITCPHCKGRGKVIP